MGAKGTILQSQTLEGVGPSAATGTGTSVGAGVIVLTGEGSFDESSRDGKGPGALVERARALGRPAHVFAGRIEAPDTGPGVTLHAITAAGVPLSEALRQAGTNLSAAVRAAFAG